MSAALTPPEIESMRDTVESTMTMRARVEMPDASQRDPYRNSAPSDWVTVIAALPCVLWTPTRLSLGGGERVGPTVNIVAGEKYLKVPVDTEITERHRIAAVTNSMGETISGPLNIREVIIRPTHTLVRTDEVR